MKKIPLTHSAFALVDDDDFDRLAQFKWWLVRKGRNRYANTTIYLDPTKSLHIKMHRMVMNAPKEKSIDHVDGDGLNNQKENLRFCNQSQNLANSKSRKGTSLFKGVSKPANRTRWVAQITHQGKHRTIGYYMHEEEAAKAYDLEALKVFGSFARTNFKEAHYV